MPRGQLVLPAALPGGRYEVRLSCGADVASRPVVISTSRPGKLLKELQFTRDAYGAGQEVTAALSFARVGGGAVAGKPLSVVATVGGQEVPVDVVKTDGQGRAVVRFVLPEVLEGEQGALTVSVEDGGLTEAISRPIPLVASQVLLEILPEGGELVVGLPGRIYFQALRASGEAASVSGRVVDDLGRVVAHFESVHDGMGRFELTPQAHRRYWAEVTEPVEGKVRTALPSPLAEGCVMAADDGLRVEVRCTQRRRVSVVGVMRERVLDGATVEVVPGRAAQVVLRASEPAMVHAQGVVRVTALGEDGFPLAERLVYRNRGKGLQIELKADRDAKTPYSLRDKVTVKIRTRDAQGKPVPATVALAAVDEAILNLADDKSAHILSALHLLPELPGPVDEPNAYFDPQNPQRAQHMDLLMGVRGWRRFDWAVSLTGDGDRDGVADPFDRCPDQSEDLDGVQDHDGCPEEGDQDNDGLVDSLDRCRDEPGPARFYGCATEPVDVDLDGINVPDDRCPEEPEDLDGFLDDDGCPDVDNDHDGILDVEDKCPNEPEVLNGFSDEDGCPDSGRVLVHSGPAPVVPVVPVPQASGAPHLAPARAGASAPPPAVSQHRVIVHRSQIQILEKIYFRPGAAQILPKSVPLLRDIARVMQVYPELRRVVVEGHTDDAGNARVNLILSQRRAEAVRNKLIELGVDPNRLIAKGYGETRPLVPNDSDDSRAVNRRVDFKIEGFDAGFSPGPVITAVRKFPAPRSRPLRPGQIRDDFRRTLHWASGIQTNAAGRATVSFFLSDAPTTVRLTTEGLGAASVGRQTLKVRARLPVEVDLQVPAHISSADALQLPVVLTNNTAKARPTKLEVNASGAVEVGQRAWALTLAPRTRQTVWVPMEAVKLSGQGAVSVRAQSDGLFDGLERTVEVHPAGMRAHQTHSGTLGAGEEAGLDVVLEHAQAGSVDAHLVLLPSTLSLILDGLEGMLTFPSGCFEQTSSKHYPNLLVLEHLSTQPDADPRAVARARKLVKAGYEALQRFMVADGGLTWFGHGKGDALMTAFGLLQWTQTHKVYPVPRRQRRALASWLLTRRDGRGGFATDVHDERRQVAVNAYITYALCESGFCHTLGAELERAAELAAKTQDPYLLALSALSLQASARHSAQADAALDRLETLQQDDGGFTGSAMGAMHSIGRSLDVQATALSIQALMRARRAQGRVEKGAQWLARHRVGSGWGSTRATATALTALVRYAAYHRSKKPGDVMVSVGDVTQRVTLKDHGGGRTLVPLGGLFKAATNPVKVTFEGEEGVLHWRLNVSSLSKRPPDHPQAQVTLTTSLSATRVEVGQPVELTVTFANQGKTSLYMPLVRVGIPSNLEIPLWQLEALQKSGVVDMVEVHREVLALYMTRLVPGQSQTLKLQTVAHTPGRAQGMASSLMPYYRQERVRWQPPLTVEVTGSK